ncbi:hypothetical protein HMPREF9302_09935 [Prevotella amnii DNF00058]|uniref:Uncharacterized protein n=1 Tax=Prevotella amnii DNF00058 TaxID=1401066 RepID=A0A096C6A6_9BACT|nr:hypothetical protein HMPREF9302_09935 [Prevotella amnii DNF00058]
MLTAKVHFVFVKPILKNIKIYNNNLYNKQKNLPIIWIKNNFIQLSVLTKEYITKIKTKKTRILRIIKTHP